MSTPCNLKANERLWLSFDYFEFAPALICETFNRICNTMPYTIGSYEFTTKGEITKRCQDIRDRTPDGMKVTEEEFAFLISLFKHHDGWHEKAYPGVEAISTETTEHGTRGFVLMRLNETKSIHISYPHAIKLIPTGAKLTPQKLIDYKAAARTAVQDQVREFRDFTLANDASCSINKTPLMRGNCDVHYLPPDTFERILFNFTSEHNIKPLDVAVDSCDSVAKLHDEKLLNAWAAYHRQHAKLQLLSPDGRRHLPKSPTDWSSVL